MYVQMVGKVRSNDCGSTYKWLRGYVCLCDRNLSEFIRTYQSLSGRIGGVGGSAWWGRWQCVVWQAVVCVVAGGGAWWGWWQRVVG